MLALCAALALVPISPARAAGTATESEEQGQARRALDRAIDGIESCCEGDLTAADWEAQRRWAYGLFRWLALSEGRPAWPALSGLRALERQVKRVGPQYAAVVAVHPADWLAERAAILHELAERQRVGSVERFAEALIVLTPLETELRRAIEARDEGIAQLEASFATARADIELAESLALRGLAKARLTGGAFNAGVAFGERSASLKAAIRRIESEIDRKRVEFWYFENGWKERTKDDTYGTASYQRALAEFQRAAERSNDKIMALTREMVDLTRKRDSLDPFDSLDETLAAITPPAEAAPRRGAAVRR